MNNISPVHVSELGILPEKFVFEQVSNDAYRNDVSDPVAKIMYDMHPNNSQALESRFFGPGQVMEAVINSDLKGEELIALKNQVVRHGLGFYAGMNTVEGHDKLTEQLGRHNLLDVTIHRHNDQTTAQASIAPLSRASADRVAQEVQPRLWVPRQRKDVLYVPILRGGLAPTLQTALYDQRSRPDADIIVYPFRVSTRKAYDRKPLLTEGETDYIRELTGRRLVVAHDDDTQSGRTLERAVDHLSTLLPKNKVVGIANQDIRGARLQEQQKRSILVNKFNVRKR